MFGSFDIAPITAGLGVQILVLRVEPFLDYCFFGLVFYKRDSLVTMPIGGTLSQKFQLSPCVLLVSEQSSGLLEDAEHQVLLDAGLCNPSSAFEIVNLKWREGGGLWHAMLLNLVHLITCAWLTKNTHRGCTPQDLKTDFPWSGVHVTVQLPSKPNCAPSRIT